MAAGNDHTRVSANAGIGLGNQYDHANVSAATSSSAAEITRIAKGIGIGGGSAVNYTTWSAPSATERTNEDGRTGKKLGAAGGSAANPA